MTMGTFGAQLFDDDAFPVALEITPPQTDLRRVLMRRATMLGQRAQAINVIQRTGRLSSLDASMALQQEGIEPVWHLVQRGRTRAEVCADIERAKAAGVGLALCIRGDHSAADLPDTPKIREIVSMVANGLPGAVVGATLNQYQSPEPVLRNLLPKIEAGASYVQTQPVFEPAHLVEMVERVRERAPETRTVAMVMPVLSAKAAARIEARIGIPLPEAFVAELERHGEEAGWAYFEESLAALAASPHADGVAVMTLAMDPGEAFTERIRVAIDRALA